MTHRPYPLFDLDDRPIKALFLLICTTAHSRELTFQAYRLARWADIYLIILIPGTSALPFDRADAQACADALLPKTAYRIEVCVRGLYFYPRCRMNPTWRRAV